MYLGWGKPEFDHITISHDVILPFQPHLPPAAGLLHRSSRYKIIKRNDFGPYEAPLEVAMNDACGLRRDGALADRPSS